MGNFLKLNNISKSYGNDKVLDDISFEIKSNEKQIHNGVILRKNLVKNVLKLRQKIFIFSVFIIGCL